MKFYDSNHLNEMFQFLDMIKSRAEIDDSLS